MLDKKKKKKQGKRDKLIKILYVTPTLNIGGAEGQLKNLIMCLDKKKFNPTVCCVTMGGEFAQDLEKMGIDVFILGKKHKLDFSILPKLINLVEENKFDIVHTFMFTANFWGRLAAILSRRNVIIISSERSMSDEKWRTMKFLDFFLAQFTDRIIANSGMVKQSVIQKEKISESKIEVIHNGIDLNRFSLRKDEFEIKESSTSKGSIVVGTVCRFDPVKDIITFLKSACLVLEKYHNVEFLLVGDALYESELLYKEQILAFISEHDIESKIHLTGFTRNVPDKLALMDIFVLTSLREGFPNAVMEAMAMSLPVVATAVGGTVELVVDGKTGFLVQPQNPEELAEKIICLRNNPDSRKKMGSNGRQRVEEEFSIDVMVKKVEKLYCRLIMRRRNAEELPQ